MLHARGDMEKRFDGAREYGEQPVLCGCSFSCYFLFHCLRWKPRNVMSDPLFLDRYTDLEKSRYWMVYPSSHVVTRIFFSRTALVRVEDQAS